MENGVHGVGIQHHVISLAEVVNKILQESAAILNNKDMASHVQEILSKNETATWILAKVRSYCIGTH